jgi:hypothetical protein
MGGVAEAVLSTCCVGTAAARLNAARRRPAIKRAVALQHRQQALAVGRTARFDDQVEDQAAPAAGQVEFVAVRDFSALRMRSA